MPQARDTTGKSRARPIIAVWLAIALMVSVMLGLAACRGFFGQAPIALLVVTLPADTQQMPVTVTFNISGSTDPDGTITSYELDYGDGSTATGTSIPTGSFTHDYATGRFYTAILTVTDNSGRTGMDTGTFYVGQEMIVFASERSGNDYGIYRMMTDGSGEGVIYDSPGNDELFPDVIRGTRDKIAYTREDSTSWDIYTMTIMGVQIAHLTTQTASNEIQPSWSYDGTKIAYASNAAQTPSSTTWEIYWVPATGGASTALTSQSPSWAIAPAYSPTSDELVFVSGVKHDGSATLGGSCIIKRAVAGTFSTLYDSTGDDGDASPAGFPSGLATILNLPTGAGISKPAWKPDGTKIAFSTDKDGDIDIYVMDSDGTNVKTLEAYVEELTGTTFADTITTSDDEFCPYWLEDGSGLAFVKKVGTAYDIYKVSFSDGTVTKLTSVGTNVSPASKKR